MTLSDVGCDYYLLFLLPCIDTLWRVLSLRYVLDIPSDIENPSHSIGALLFRAALEAADCSSVGQPCTHSIAAITPSYTQQFVRSGTRFTINSLIRTRMKRFIHVLPRSFCTSRCSEPSCFSFAPWRPQTRPWEFFQVSGRIEAKYCYYFTNGLVHTACALMPLGDGTFGQGSWPWNLTEFLVTGFLVMGHLVIRAMGKGCLSMGPLVVVHLAMGFLVTRHLITDTCSRGPWSRALGYGALGHRSLGHNPWPRAFATSLGCGAG